MRLKNDEYTLLKRIHWELVSCGRGGLPHSSLAY